MDRNYDDPAYKEARIKTLKRDGFSCKWPNCGSNERLRVHHIRTWADHPSLRFVLNNLITLCKYHHDMIWGQEENYEKLFFQIIKSINNDTRPKQCRKPRGNKSNTGNKTKDKKERTFAQKYAEAKRKARKKRKR
jgi:hypothetical protein